jgi:hypothetical protein
MSICFKLALVNSVADPGCLSWIRIFFQLGSWPGSNNKKDAGNNLVALFTDPGVKKYRIRNTICKFDFADFTPRFF